MMSKISKSPDRGVFQKTSYIKRCEEKAEEPQPEYLDMYDSFIEKEKDKFSDPKSHINNLEYDLLTTDWILEKARNCDWYAQNIYAALCNNEFTRLDVMPILKQEKWNCSWRYAGGIVADMQQKGDYIDWYCSGIRDRDSLDPAKYATLNEEEKAQYDIRIKYAPEGMITEEIRIDFQRLGWVPAEGGDWEHFL